MQARSSPSSTRQRLPSPHESGHGLPILTLAATSTLTGAGAVVLIALIPAGWVLGFALAVLIMLLGVVVMAVLRAVSTGGK